MVTGPTEKRTPWCRFESARIRCKRTYAARMESRRGSAASHGSVSSLTRTCCRPGRFQNASWSVFGPDGAGCALLLLRWRMSHRLRGGKLLSENRCPLVLSRVPAFRDMYCRPSLVTSLATSFNRTTLPVAHLTPTLHILGKPDVCLAVICQTLVCFCR